VLQGGQTLALPDIPNYDAFSSAQSVQSALLILRVEGRNAGAKAPDWVVSLQCTMQGTDNKTLAGGAFCKHARLDGPQLQVIAAGLQKHQKVPTESASNWN
jgi:hypothetical protein